MQTKKQTKMWKGLMNLTMSLCLITLTISPTLSAEECQPCNQTLEKCVKSSKGPEEGDRQSKDSN
jgi:hypothetical protein